MTPERRAQIIKQSLANLRRFQDENEGLASPDRAWPADAEARAAGPTPVLPSDPPIDPVTAWRLDGERRAQMREQGRAEIRAQERQHTERDQAFWQSVDVRIAQALDTERAFFTDVLRDALQAVNEIAEATADKFEQLDTKLDALGKLLQQLREGNESAQRRARARAREEADGDLVDVTPPLVTKRSVN
jgi:hypothetical protein